MRSATDMSIAKVARPDAAVKRSRKAALQALSVLRPAPILRMMVRMRIEDGATKPAGSAGAGLRPSGLRRGPAISARRARAPRSHLFYWFCLDHVRAYNAAWNYYAGMSAAEIEREIRNDTVWQRPTWPLGTRAGMRYAPRFRDYGLFGLDDEDEPHERRARAPPPPGLAAGTGARYIQSEPPLTLVGLKARYKELVKLHHPDVHGGDKAAEERLKIINLAYATLKASYFP